MKFVAVAVLALAVASPALAGSNFVVDFERTWEYGDGVANYYNGGTTDLFNVSGGPNLGVSFVNVLGVSNDPAFIAYANAPSPLGIAQAYTFTPTDRAFINVAAGVDNLLSFYYSTPASVSNAIQAYSGLNGTGTLLGSFNLVANSSASYDTWTQASVSFVGSARSFELTNAANLVGFDNISAVPESGSLSLMMAGVAGLLLSRKVRRRV